jgi:hypothetical protein
MGLCSRQIAQLYAQSIVIELTEPCMQIIYLSSAYEMLLHLVIRGQIREGGHFWFTGTVVCNKANNSGQELFGIARSVLVLM